jgi:NAD-dependent deacetylase
VFLAVGTSLSVQPVAGLVDVASRRGAKVVIVNAERTPYDSKADARLDGPIGTVLPQLVGEVASDKPPAASAG